MKNNMGLFDVQHGLARLEVLDRQQAVELRLNLSFRAHMWIEEIESRKEFTKEVAEHPEYQRVRYRLTDKTETYEGYEDMWHDLNYLESMLYIK